MESNLRKYQYIQENDVEKQGTVNSRLILAAKYI